MLFHSQLLFSKFFGSSKRPVGKACWKDLLGLLL
jgi:hypothetical protein